MRTKSMKLKKSLGNSEAEGAACFKSLVEGISLGVCLVQDGRIAYANPGFTRMTGRTVDELAVKDLVDDILLVDDVESARDGMGKVLSGKAGSYMCQAGLRKKDGEVAEVESTFTLMDHNGRPALIGAVIDVTEKKRLERQKSYFLSIITHDFKTPLTTIMGYAELIASYEGLEKKVAEMAASVFKNGEKLHDMVQDFLFHAKLESKLLSPVFAPVDVNTILDELHEEFAVQAMKKKQTIRLEFTDELALLLLDKKLVERALYNIVQNAVNHTPEGGTITIKAERRNEAGGSFASISVSDTGPGIPPEQRNKIFDKYLNYNNANRTRGSGLGLTIAKAVTEAHSGKLELESVVGLGSTFRLVLPIMPRPVV